MYRLTSKLIIYRNISKDSILYGISHICRRFETGDYDREILVDEIYTQINRLLDLATQYGFNKNLWQNYLAYLIGMTENPFTLISEKKVSLIGSVNEFAKNDYGLFKELFHYDFTPMENALGINCFSVLTNYHAVEKNEHIYNKSVSEKIQQLSLSIAAAKTDEEVCRIVSDFYNRYGVGKLGLNKAFRVCPSASNGILQPITSIGTMTLDDLVGYENQKQELLRNTEAFIQGRKANNVLLYGDAGTGKSTSVKAILNQYYDAGLRMIEVYKHEFKYLSQIIDEIKNRNYRFIIFMDDLSFEEFEIDYKYLKAVIEGGLETKPENVLIYATSNRRHLIRETWTDRSDRSADDVHHSDTMQEKLSLADRFGVTIGYFRPSPSEYHQIVETLANRYPEIELPLDELIAQANKWRTYHGGISGRSAQQFINYLLSSKQ